MNEKKIQIIGAGFAGLTLAYHLARSGWTVTVIEKQNRVGGLIETKKTEFGLVETAASSLIYSPEIAQLLSELNISVIPANKDSKKRFLFRGHFTRWPLNFKETCQFIIKIIPKIIKTFIFKKTELQPRSGESIREWGYRNLGEKPTTYLLEAAMNGIYAGDPRQLSASLILGGLFRKKTKTQNNLNQLQLKNYRGIVSTENGMEEILIGIKNSCINFGVDFQLEKTFSPTKIDIPTVIATDVQSAADIFSKINSEVSKLLLQIPKMNMLRITTFWKEANHNYLGFGGLIPAHYGFQSLGILFNSMIFKQNHQFYNESQISGGPLHQDIIHYQDSETEEIFLSERRQLLNITIQQKPISFHITRWNMKLPQYNVTNENILEKLKYCLLQINQSAQYKNSPIYLHGNYLNGIGLSKIYERTLQLENELNQYASNRNHT